MIYLPAETEGKRTLEEAPAPFVPTGLDHGRTDGSDDSPGTATEHEVMARTASTSSIDVGIDRAEDDAVELLRHGSSRTETFADVTPDDECSEDLSAEDWVDAEDVVALADREDAYSDGETSYEDEDDVAGDEEDETSTLKLGRTGQTVLTDGRDANGALRHARELAREYGATERMVELLTKVFELHGWSGAKRSMKDLLTDGLNEDELAVAMHAREQWRHSPELHQGDRYVREELPWRLARDLARRVDLDRDILDHELFEIFDDWHGAGRRRRDYPSFVEYLRAELNGDVHRWGARGPRY